MPDSPDGLDTGAIFSPCRTWRYLLWRYWDRSKPICAFIGLNPSTADETQDDPTVRRCIRFAKDWGYGALWMLNAYAFRATDPRDLKQVMGGMGAIGPQTDTYLQQAAVNCGIVIAAWGAHCPGSRQDEIRAMFAGAGKPLYLLGQTKDGCPRHPLYLRADTQPVRWMPPWTMRPARVANG
ncbi:MAG: DUF1643 domain-containing protein [Hyalangium sp.]|uniref:DUF1643 domain-containing protein n=1 Tax=Hyalangium sp. TaxID=2028555 RepID=UPI00389AF610